MQASGLHFLYTPLENTGIPILYLLLKNINLYYICLNMDETFLFQLY